MTVAEPRHHWMASASQPTLHRDDEIIWWECARCHDFAVGHTGKATKNLQPCPSAGDEPGDAA